MRSYDALNVLSPPELLRSETWPTEHERADRRAIWERQYYKTLHCHLCVRFFFWGGGKGGSLLNAARNSDVVASTNGLGLHGARCRRQLFSLCKGVIKAESKRQVLFRRRWCYGGFNAAS